MDTQLIATARTCLNAAYNKTLAFPNIVGTLIAAGFDGYMVDYCRNTTTYFLPDGDNAVLENAASQTKVAAPFDQAGIAAQIKRAQPNPPDYSDAAFCNNVKDMGCEGCFVSFSGRRVLYFGRTAETHVELFPQ